MKFEWDENKNTLNQQKHGISFEQALEVFDDPQQISILDYRFNYREERWITLGATKGATTKGATKKIEILVVANLFFTDSGSEIVRIISARRANKKEIKQYEIR